MLVRNEPPIPRSWSRLQFGDCAEFINGRAYGQDELLEAGTPVLRIQNLTGGDRWYYSNLKLPKDKYCEDGDLLFAWSASFGPYIWKGPKCIFHYHIWRVIPRQNLDKKFAYYLLGHLTRELKTSARGIAMLHLTKSGMEAHEISLPPLDEQRRIAAILDQADDLRRKRREALGRLDLLSQNTFTDFFGDVVENDRNWTMEALSSTVENFEGGKNIVADGDESGNPIRVLKISAVQEDGFDEQESKALPNGYEPPAHHFVRRGDLLLSRANTTERVGLVALVERDVDNLVLPDKILRFIWRSGSVACAQYWLSCFRSVAVRRLIGRLATGTSGSMKNISQEKLLKMKLALPPLELQRDFATRVTEIDRLKARHTIHLAKLNMLFASLQHRAFRGEL